MTGNQVIEHIGFERAISVDRPIDGVSQSDASILTLVRKQEFNIDAVYFNTDHNGNSFPAIFLKKVVSFDEENLKGIARTHQKIWNYKKVLFLYVYSDLEIRIYNCSEKPIVHTEAHLDYDKELKKIELDTFEYTDAEQLQRLSQIFSRVAIDTGVLWTLQEAKAVRDKINLQRRVDKYLVESLVNTATRLEAQGLDIDFIHKIILRSLFLLYLEDRGATDAKFYSEIKKGASSYFDILEDPKATYALYKRLEEDFNGNVFTIDEGEQITSDHLKQIQICFRSGDDNSSEVQIFEDWRLFDFSIIQIELLSEIYETFLFKTDPKQKKNTGTYYTPPSLVEFILNEKLPTSTEDNKYNTKILDPSCGSGIFLVESFNRLVKKYEQNTGEQLTDFTTLKEILTNNIFGIEIHPQAVKVAAFSLYLALVDKLDPKTLWQKKKHRLPNLINDPRDDSIEVQGSNLYRRDTISDLSEITQLQDFDLVVGNPPFGRKNLSESIRTYCEEYDFAKEMVLPFLHKATQFAPNGDIALIFNTKVLTNTGSKYQNFRGWIFNNTYVDKVYNFSILRKADKKFGGQLFGDATGPVSIIMYRNVAPKQPNDKILYYAPKTYIRSNVINGLSIDFSDLHYLPRIECQKPDTKIWKIAMWGGNRDWNLVQKLLSNYNLQKYLDENEIEYSVGIQPINKSTKKVKVDNEISKMKFIRPELIDRFYTSERNFSHINTILKNTDTKNIYLEYYSVDRLDNLPDINVFRRVTGKHIFDSPKLVAKEGFKDNKVCFSFIDKPVVYNSSILGFKSKDVEKLRLLSSLLNSSLASYFLLLVSNSWGIERERIKPNEIYQFPITENKEIGIQLVALHKEIESRIKGAILTTNIADLENRIDTLVSELYGISSDEHQLMEDFINLTVDLFLKHKKSKALFPSTGDQVTLYAESIIGRLNNFLEGQELYASATTYFIRRATPLMMIKISFSSENSSITQSKEDLDLHLKLIDKNLWERKATNIYFRKKLNYKSNNDIYIIRPNQRRFWSVSRAIEDASELILEILNEV